MSLAGQRVVVVGGTSGMGRATVRAAAELGAEVVAAGRRSLDDRDVIEGVRQAQVDVTDESSVRALFDGIGEFDHLFVSVVARNARSVPRAGRRRGPHLPRRQGARELELRPLRRAEDPGGRIDHLRHGRCGRSAPRATPRWSRRRSPPSRPSRARWHSSWGRCASTRSGPATPTARCGRTSPRRNATSCAGKWRRRCRSGRMGTPEDIAHAAVFLMTSRQTTGAVLEVSGGETLVDALG